MELSFLKATSLLNTDRHDLWIYTTAPLGIMALPSAELSVHRFTSLLILLLRHDTNWGNLNWKMLSQSLAFSTVTAKARFSHRNWSRCEKTNSQPHSQYSVIVLPFAKTSDKGPLFSDQSAMDGYLLFWILIVLTEIKRSFKLWDKIGITVKCSTSRIQPVLINRLETT